MHKEKNHLKKLQTYIETGQSIAVVEPSDHETKQEMERFIGKTALEYPTVYVDFNTIEDSCDLAKTIFGQCKKIIRERDIAEPDCVNSYHALDSALNLLEEAAEQSDENVCFVLRNYTNVLKIDDGRRIQEHMRAVLQHQHNVCCVFTGTNKALVNEIFMKPDAPFFRFARIADLR